jgi:uncharacterized protein
MHDYPAIFQAILAKYKLDIHGDHGVYHWARVMENGIKISEETGADAEVVRLFALFHDSRRKNENIDDEHGYRGAELAFALRGKLVNLDDEQFWLLYKACDRHTEGRNTKNQTIQACWDADRLDLGRVGIVPEKSRLGSKTARGLYKWAHQRAVDGHISHEVLAAWGCR